MFVCTTKRMKYKFNFVLNYIITTNVSLIDNYEN